MSTWKASLIHSYVSSVYAALLNTKDSWWLCVLAVLAAVGAAWWAAQAAAGVVEGLAASLIHEEAEWQCAADLHRCRVAQHPCAGQSCAQLDRGLVHEVLPVTSEDSHPPTTPVPWGAAELVVFASSMARQVAHKLSDQDDLVNGLVERFAEDLRWLSQRPTGPSQADQHGVWQQEPGEALWWPVWWCPFSSQWPDIGMAAASSTAAGEQTAGSVVGLGGQEHAEGTPDPAGRTRHTKKLRRRGKKKKAARGCAAVYAPESEEEQWEGSEPSSGPGAQCSLRWDSAASAGGRKTQPSLPATI